MDVLMSFVTQHFFLILLFVAMFSMKEHRLAGLILLVVQVLWGTVVPVFILVIAVQVLWEICRWNTYGGIIHRGDMHNNWKPQHPEARKKMNEGPRRGTETRPPAQRRDPDYD